MISLSNITVSYGSFTLLDSISFHISDNERIGLVGKNGAGKSTLMKILCGLQSPTSGQVDKPANVKIAYLPQIMEHHRGRTVLQETLTAFDGMKKLEQEMEAIAVELDRRRDYDSSEYNSLINRMNEISDLLSFDSSEPPAVQAEKTLLGLGFRPEDLEKHTETFSQGWNMRIELAKILLSKPDLMLLDEPTNHLDIESIEWLEDYLRERKGSLLLVSHDRRFLDNVTGRTIEIMLGHIHDYKVPYSKYTELRAERMEQQRAAYENQQRMIEKSEDFISRFRYKPTKSNQVQSRIKALDKLDRIQVDETDKATLAVKFPPAPRAGDVVFSAKALTAAYPGKTVFTEANVEIRRGEKVAFVGRNGEGKTTMVRLMTGELTAEEGQSKLGHNVQMGYYAQNQEDILDGKLTVMETLDRAAVGEIRSKLRDILAQFLFRGEDIDKRVSVLSGGERARLAMAKLMLQPYNLLILDEPTNHMDIKSKDILKQALAAYDGTLVAVSHDRDFLDGLVDKIYEFRNGKVKEHLGGIGDFLRRRRLENLNELERKDAPVVRESPPEQASSRSKQEFIARKAVSREEKRLRNRFDFLEKEIDKLEKKMKEIERRLVSPTENDDIMELTRLYLEAKRDLDAKTEEWGGLLETLENQRKI